MAFEKVNTHGVDNLPGEYTCESGDVKPTDNIVKHSTCWELDAKIGFIFDGSSWREV